MINCLLNTYNPLPISFERGDGVWLFDQNGRQYLDALCGIAVTGLGHNHPSITKTIQEQAEKLIHISNLVKIPQQMDLATALSKTSGMNSKVFFSNSGAEAVECGIKFCRLYGHSKNIDNPKIVVMEGAFHGRTLAALSASSSRKVQAGFEPLVQGFVRANFNDPQALKNIAGDPEVVAVMLEPVQGEGGIRVPDEGYLNEVRTICDENNWLMICDEIQTGMGRTGKLFAYQHASIIPDAVILAKGLANGVPIGACLVRDKFCDLFTPGSHGSTFGGNPLSCSVGLSTLETILNENLVDNAEKQGKVLLNGLKDRLANHPHVVEIRGKGLMIGVELDKPCREILTLALKKGILFNITNMNTMRLLPPLTIQSVQVEQILETIPALIDEFYPKG